MPRVVAIIQARMSSTRLPGKVLLDIDGQPMLARVVSRTSRAATVDEVIVATTRDASDDPVSAFCGKLGVRHIRGSQEDVLDRYYQAASQANTDVVVRITADCPVIDPSLIDEVVNTLLGRSSTGSEEFDFAADRLPPPFSRSFPIGLDVEACTFTGLETAWNEATAAFHREHVVPFLYEGVELHPQNPLLATGVSQRGFRIALLNHVPDYGAMRWTVDMPEDLDFVRQVYARFGGRDDFSWKDVLSLVQSEPALAAINAAVRHKSLYDK